MNDSKIIIGFCQSTTYPKLTKMNTALREVIEKAWDKREFLKEDETKAAINNV